MENSTPEFNSSLIEDFYHIQIDYDEDLNNMDTAYFMMFGLPVIIAIYLIFLICIVKYFRRRNNRLLNTRNIPDMNYEMIFVETR